MSVLGIIDSSECDERGVPLDWERCQVCGGAGRVRLDLSGVVVCEKCDGLGSLKAAALVGRLRALYGVGGPGYLPDWREHVRCESCGHPMSDGTWEGDLRTAPITVTKAHLTFIEPAEATDEDWAGRHLIAGAGWLHFGSEPPDWAHVATHFSRCDEGCRHRGPVRGWWTGKDKQNGPGHGELWSPGDGTFAGRLVEEWGSEGGMEASWRPVDVRVGMLAKRAGMDVATAGPLVLRPFDLRPENLTIECLRCWAARRPA